MKKQSLGYYQFSTVSFLVYFSLGAIIAFLTPYFESIGYSGLQIGSINAFKSFVTILSPILLGLLSDHLQKHKIIFIATLLVTLILTVFLPFVTDFLPFLALFTIFSFFQVALCPLSDSLLLHAPFAYGSVRKWGSFGFAFSALLTGLVVDAFGLPSLFIVFGISIFLSILAVKNTPLKPSEDDFHMLADLRILFKNRQFLLLLFISLAVGMTFINNGVFFSLLYQNLGGGFAGIGVALMLFALSEAPFMQATSRLINRFGHLPLMLFATVITSGRWLFYASTNSNLLILLFSFLQGLSIGLFIPASTEYLKTIVKPSVKTTALSIYLSVYIGIGGIIGGYIGGYLYDYYRIQDVYLFFAISSTIGALFILWLMVYHRRHHLTTNKH